MEKKSRVSIIKATEMRKLTHASILALLAGFKSVGISTAASEAERLARVPTRVVVEPSH